MTDGGYKCILIRELPKQHFPVISIYLLNIQQHWQHKIDTFSQSDKEHSGRHTEDHSRQDDVSPLVLVSFTLKSFYFIIIFFFKFGVTQGDCNLKLTQTR